MERPLWASRQKKARCWNSLASSRNPPHRLRSRPGAKWGHRTRRRSGALRLDLIFEEGPGRQWGEATWIEGDGANWFWYVDIAANGRFDVTVEVVEDLSAFGIMASGLRPICRPWTTTKT